MNQMETIRNRSISFVSKLGLPVNPQLPLLENPHVPRSTEAVVNRIFAMSCMTACAFGFDRTKGWSWLEKENCLNDLTPSEVKFFETGVANIASINDRIECIWVLAWCVNKVGELNPLHPCSDDLVFLMPDLKKMESGDSFRNTAFLRPEIEIIQHCDLAYCLHWSIVDCDFIGKKKWNLPISPSEIIERRHALEWMLYLDHWDDIDMDT